MRFSISQSWVILGAVALGASAIVSAQLSPEEAAAKMKAKEEARHASTQASVDDVVRAVNNDLRKENAALKMENSSLKAENDKLKGENAKLKKDLADARGSSGAGDAGNPSKTIFDDPDKDKKKK